MPKDTKQNQVKYLWIPDTYKNTNMSEELASIMSTHKGEIPYKTLEEKLKKRFSFNPIIQLDNPSLDRVIKTHKFQHSNIYMLRDGIVYDIKKYHYNFTDIN